MYLRRFRTRALLSIVLLGTVLLVICSYSSIPNPSSLFLRNRVEADDYSLTASWWDRFWSSPRKCNIGTPKPSTERLNTADIYPKLDFRVPDNAGAGFWNEVLESRYREIRETWKDLPLEDNASKITGSDMPLYFPCPCRSSKPQIAQLMRIHVVTPKAPVHVTLHPKVQPAPEPCPLFFPTISEPLKLSQSAYWVLRLPFVYEGEHGPYLPPREPVPVSACRLLKGTYNIAEQQSNR